MQRATAKQSLGNPFQQRMFAQVQSYKLAPKILKQGRCGRDQVRVVQRVQGKAVSLGPRLHAHFLDAVHVAVGHLKTRSAIRVGGGLLVAALLALQAGQASAQQLTTAALEKWLAGYERAWESRDPARAAELFTSNASYQETPFEPPKVGQAGIREYWSSVTADQRDIDFKSQVVAVNGQTAVAHWSATFTVASTGARVELDGVFLLTFDLSGRCSELREWWHLRP